MEAIFYLAIALAVAILILWQRIKDGVVIKFGLILVLFGFIGASVIRFSDQTDLSPALWLVGWGIATCILGILIRGLCTGGKCRRFEDWFEQHSGAEQ